MMMMVMIINSDDDDNEEGNGGHFSWQEYKHFFIRHLVIRSDILLWSLYQEHEVDNPT